jgi:hypothetical protein
MATAIMPASLVLALLPCAYGNEFDHLQWGLTTVHSEDGGGICFQLNHVLLLLTQLSWLQQA